ncbi:hypothetical protein ACFXPA_44185 [Amycolatopsis sp. NPDC059090]|uniref:hypothetical protein n=1 Tax=unclassified Amycolatopsis TaxID=2618356 RepID=UPI00366DB065
MSANFQYQPYDNVRVSIAWNYETRAWQYHVAVTGGALKIFSDVRQAQRYVDSRGRGFRNVPGLAKVAKKLTKP